MFLIDTIHVVHYDTPLKKNVRTFKITEYCKRVNPLFLVTLDGKFFCTVESIKEAHDEIEAFCDEEGYIEVIFR